MQLRSRQQGMGIIQWAVIIAVVGLLGVCGYHLVPVYIDHITVKTMLQNAAADPEAGKKSPSELRHDLVNPFITNRIEFLKPQDIKFTVERGVIIMNGNYEQRVPLIYNIDAVVKFDDLVFEIPRH